MWLQALVAKEKEPITPFIARIRALAAGGTSAVLVMGGSGDYFGALETAHAGSCDKTLPMPFAAGCSNGSVRLCICCAAWSDAES